MARQEDDREDLLRQATALVRRAELQLANWPPPVTLGFRRDGGFAVFFGSDPVYQFNARGELRRAFAGGVLLKAEAGQLVELRRERTAIETALIRRELVAPEQGEFMRSLAAHLRELQEALASGRYEQVGCVPAEANVAQEALDWLHRHPEIGIADKPHAERL